MSGYIHIVCGHCDSIVRVQDSRLSQAPRCPKCHNALFEGRSIALRTANFERHVAHTGLPLIVDFWAPWCGPCKMMAPAYEEAARRMEPRARFAKVNTEEEPTLGARFNIRSIPTLAVFRNAKEVARQSGAVDASALVRWIDSVVGP